MELYNIMIYFVSNLFLTYIFYRFSCVFLKKDKINKNIELVAYFIFFVVSSSVTIVFKNPILNLFVNIAGLLLLTMIYNDKLIKKTFFVIFIYGVPLPIDIIVSRVVGSYHTGVVYYSVGNTIVTLLFFIIELILEKILKNIDDKGVSDNKSIFLLFVPILSIMMTILMIYYTNPDIKLIIIQCICILLINIITFNLYDWMIGAYNNKYENELLERQVESYMNQVEIMKQSQEKINSIRHDIKHHMLAINDMASKNNNKEIVEYLNQMEDRINNSNEYVKCGNDGIDAILNYMVNQAKILTNNISIKVKVPEKIELNKFDINTILGNLLQNSLRALKEIEKRELKISIQYDKGIMYIYIENSYSGILNKRGNKILSTKKATDIHGIGLENVKGIVDKYNGIMNINTENKRFIVDIMLYI